YRDDQLQSAQSGRFRRPAKISQIALDELIPQASPRSAKIPQTRPVPHVARELSDKQSRVPSDIQTPSQGADAVPDQCQTPLAQRQGPPRYTQTIRINTWWM